MYRWYPVSVLVAVTVHRQAAGADTGAQLDFLDPIGGTGMHVTFRKKSEMYDKPGEPVFATPKGIGGALTQEEMVSGALFFCVSHGAHLFWLQLCATTAAVLLPCIS